MTPATARRRPSELVRDEIAEQPEVVARLLSSAPTALETVARQMLARGVRLVVFAARGTSDNAAIYGQYLLGLRNGLAVSLATPSLTTLYGATPGDADAPGHRRVSIEVSTVQSGARETKYRQSPTPSTRASRTLIMSWALHWPRPPRPGLVD